MAGSATGFTVTCSSTSSVDMYPQNVGSCYTVKLPKAIDLTEASLGEKAGWQAAMLSIQYTHNFINFPTACTLRIIIRKPPESQVSMDTPASTNCYVLNNPGPINESGMDDMDVGVTMYERKQQLLARYRSTRGPMLYGKIYLPAGHYSSIADFLADIVRRCDDVFKPRYNVRFHSVQYADGTVEIAVSDSNIISIYSDSEYAAQTLGLPSAIEDIYYISVPMYKIEPRGVRAALLDTVQALYVYADIVEYQHVGDKMLPLLAYVDVEKSPGERVAYFSNPPSYLPVRKSVIDTITIKICDERGEYIKFPADGDNVLIRLHFRPVTDQSRI
jgi:hypothetical protein